MSETIAVAAFLLLLSLGAAAGGTVAIYKLWSQAHDVGTVLALAISSVLAGSTVGGGLGFLVWLPVVGILLAVSVIEEKWS